MRTLIRILPLFSVLIFTLFAFAQEPAPLFRANWNDIDFAGAGWTTLPASGFEPADTRIGLVPTNPNDQSGEPGRGVLVTAAPGQGTLAFGPVVAVGDDPVLLRLSVLASAPGAVIAMGVFDVAPDGSIFDTDNTGFFLFENDSAEFVDGYVRLTAFYNPKSNAVIPLIQFAVQPGGDAPVTGMFEDFEIFPLDAATVSDPALQSLFGVEGGVEPTPTLTPTPTPTQPPIDPTPTPGEVPDFELEFFIDVSPLDDGAAASDADVAFDRDGKYVYSAADSTLGFRDAILYDFDAESETVSDAVAVNEPFEDTRVNDTAIEIGPGANRMVVWSDDRRLDKHEGIFLTSVNETSERLFIEDVWINEAFDDTDAINPSIDLNDAGEMVVVWQDDRFFDTAIFARRFNWDGADLTSKDDVDLLANITFEDTAPADPDVALGDDGRIVVVWSDDRIAVEGQRRNDVYARYFKMKTDASEDGVVPDSNKEIRVSLTDEVFDHATTPRIAFGGRYFLAVWVNENPDTHQRNIHGAVLEDDADIRVTEFIIDLGESTARATAPSVAKWDEDQFVITWYDEATGEMFVEFYDARENAYLTDPVVLTDNMDGVANTAVAVGGNRVVSVWDNLFEGLSEVTSISMVVNAEGVRKQSAARMVEAPGGGLYQKSAAKLVTQPRALLIEKTSLVKKQTKPRRNGDARKTIRTQSAVKKL
ncbi:MAG: hypothetical protein P9L94_12930 [Candidatus Hinthialibacter antarcticus]|nr:hypothetical protein [Candidatus Hinthialibacter antarcticus]